MASSTNHIRANILRILIWMVLVTGITASMTLVMREFTQGNVCPKLLGVPACVIITLCLLFASLSHADFFGDKHRIYFISVSLALLIAIAGSILNFLGITECPQTGKGIPMCYLSFLLFSVLLALKVIDIRDKSPS